MDGSEGVALTLDLQTVIEHQLTSLSAETSNNALSEWSFSNLYLFREAHGYRYIGGNWPRITGRTYDGVRHVFPLFPLHEAPAAVQLQLLRGHDCFYPLCEAQIRRLASAHFTLEACRDDADYLYPATNFAHYRGSVLQKKRNLMKQCHATHRIETRPYGPECKEAALAVLDGWLFDKGMAQEDADARPCREALSVADRLHLAGYVHWADGQPAGFVLAELLQPGVAVMRFAKGLASVQGIAQAMFHHFATSPPWPLQFMNFEQDLGRANFRQTKASYQPMALLSKWRARPSGLLKYLA